MFYFYATYVFFMHLIRLDEDLWLHYDYYTAF